MLCAARSNSLLPTPATLSAEIAENNTNDEERGPRDAAGQHEKKNPFRQRFRRVADLDAMMAESGITKLTKSTWNVGEDVRL